MTPESCVLAGTSRITPAATATCSGREMVVPVDGFTMQILVAQMSETPERLDHTGPPRDADGPELRRLLAGKSPACAWHPRPRKAKAARSGHGT